MKRNVFSFVRSALLLAGCTVTTALILSSCSKTNDTSYQNTAVSAVMAFNLTDKSSVGFSLSGTALVSSGISFNGYTGGYLSVYAGAYDVKSYDATAGTTLAETSNTYDTSKYYSVFAVGANGTYQNITVKDNYDSLSSNNAYIRYINAIPDSTKPVITVNASGQVVINETGGFGTVSSFVAVTPGDVTITAGNGGTIQTTRTITNIAQGNVYTVLISGFPGATDTTKAVQIKYINNGTLSGS